MISRTPLLLLLVAGCSGSTNIDTEGGTSQATGTSQITSESSMGTSGAVTSSAATAATTTSTGGADGSDADAVFGSQSGSHSASSGSQETGDGGTSKAP